MALLKMIPAAQAYTENQVAIVLTRDYLMSATKITQKQWKALGFPNPSIQKCDECPVVLVNWYEALAFCNALSRYKGLEECYDLSSCTGEVGGGCPDGAGGCDEDEGAFVCAGEVHRYESFKQCDGYRLPTAVEWERAARAGTTTGTYNGDLTADNFCECEADAVLEPIAWYCANSNHELNAVGSKTPNAWGLYDMLGNTTEWADYVNDGFDLAMTEGKDPPLVDPSGPLEAGADREVRGGYFGSCTCTFRAAWRVGFPPDVRLYGTGFRIVRTLPGSTLAAEQGVGKEIVPDEPPVELP